MKSFDIVGYTYDADNYCYDCITEIAADHARPDAIVVPLLLNTQTLLTEWAEREGIDQYDESSYDSGDFPKVIFADAIEEDEYCGACHRPILENAR